ncbi:unnamed protein product [Blepharisma stoltei]|uniref:Tetratricopeptide repeat protein n=1 Tax=Blepharisma stoltei TaxID=1481888 RepID=A0AAU9JUS8_9CILI|nr:unnamed protein product [Blepharisma stoltei]
MMAKKCFESECTNEVEYSCTCSSPKTLSCEVHIGEHVSFPDRAHNIESMFIQPCEGTKEAILEFLTMENSKYSELRRKIIDSLSKCPFNLKRNLRDFRKKLNDCSDEINDFFAKIFQVKTISKLEQDPILELLVLPPGEAVEKVKSITIAMKDRYNSAKFFYLIIEKLLNLNRSFVKEKCDANRENINMQNAPEVHNKTIESANVKDSISLIINESSEPENVSKPIKKSLENETNLLNSHISTISNDLNKLKETESALKVIDTLRNKTAEILSRPNNPEFDIDFRTTCSAIQTNSSFYDPPLMEAYQDYLKAYQQRTSLYNIKWDYVNKRTGLHIYNTETETQEDIKTLQTPEPLDSKTCITHLPNGKLFCFGNKPRSGRTLLIDVNGGIEKLPSGTPCYWSSCTYFKNSVYCFGGYVHNDNDKESNKLGDCDVEALHLSNRFDLDQNRWIELIPMPQADYLCSSITFNGNILISGHWYRNLLLYSIDIDSFSTIPCKFAKRKRKILINVERLYLIECSGSIYESEIGSYSNWRRIGKSAINSDPVQVYCSYNKGGIYISTIPASDYHSAREYYYFNLDQKIIIDVAYYNEPVSLRRVGQKIEAIKWNNQNFNLDPSLLDEWNLKGKALNTLGENLKAIEYYDEAIKLNPKEVYLYLNKGYTFCHLERYLEAIECYDEAIKLNPKDDCLYNIKGNAFYALKRYLEAIECYDEAIKLNPKAAYLYNIKGSAFYALKRYLEAIECYDEAIKLDPDDAGFHYFRGNALNELRRYPEVVESVDKAIKINPNSARFYNRKGNALYAL